jgi:hypothetical protein
MEQRSLLKGKTASEGCRTIGIPSTRSTPYSVSYGGNGTKFYGNIYHGLSGRDCTPREGSRIADSRDISSLGKSSVSTLFGETILSIEQKHHD